jgi:hypothetical protein
MSNEQCPKCNRPVGRPGYGPHKPNGTTCLKFQLSDAELNGEAIMEARAYLSKHLGKMCEQAFFDDCIHNAVAMCLRARAEVSRLRKRLAKAKEKIK